MKRILIFIIAVLFCIPTFTSCDFESDFYSVVTLKIPNSTEKEPQHNLEFWIAENVDKVDFSGFQQKYGLMGGYEYYGTGYEPTVGEEGQQVDPEHCVIYTVTNYPDYSSRSLHITHIKITDPNISIYGLSLASSKEEIKNVMTEEGYTVTESGKAICADKDKIRFVFSEYDITINAEVTNHTGIIF